MTLLFINWIKMSSPPPDFSPFALLLHADSVVQGVVALLLLASVAVWAVVLEKTVRLRTLSREVRALRGTAGADSTDRGGATLAAQALAAARGEWGGGRDPGETAGEFRYRIECAVRAAATARLREAEGGLSLLATVGSVAPFVGLFGTVWGILHSFAGIAARGDTSLAAVAPGIAEALFATAVGLVAAIPATVAYNRFAARLSRLRAEAAGAAADLATRMARRPALAAAAE